MTNDQPQHPPVHTVFPLFVNLSGRLAVVVGGGEVGRRKAQAVLAGGGRVRLVCLEPKPAGTAFAAIDWHATPYSDSYLDDAFLVFAAATAEVNRQVVRDARARGVLVNVADDPVASDFLMPATLRRGPLTVAVSTGGTAPALAREVRRLLDELFDDAFASWLEALADLRPVILARVADHDQRRRLFRQLAERAWWERFRHEDQEVVRRMLHDEVL